MGTKNEGFEGSFDEAAKSDVVTTDQKNAPDETRIEETDTEEELCGYGHCRPKSMQCCNDPKTVLFWLCMFAFIQGEY